MLLAAVHAKPIDGGQCLVVVRSRFTFYTAFRHVKLQVQGTPQTV